MDLHATALPAFTDNYIWTFAGAAGAVVVDPGDARPVEEYLRAQGVSLQAILITHHHPDHIGGVAALRRIWPECAVYAPTDPRAGERTHSVREGDQLTVAGEYGLQVMELPGHTRSHVGYYGSGALFCGDTLFSLGCGRRFEGSAEAFLASLDRLAALPASTRVYCTHEYTLSNARFALAVDADNPALQARVRAATAQRAAGQPTLPSLLAEELACNPFLRVDAYAIEAALATRGDVAATRAGRFAALRAWKDGYS